jgi:hypothetical protein
MYELSKKELLHIIDISNSDVRLFLERKFPKLIRSMFDPENHIQNIFDSCEVRTDNDGNRDVMFWVCQDSVSKDPVPFYYTPDDKTLCISDGKIVLDIMIEMDWDINMARHLITKMVAKQYSLEILKTT